MDARLLPTCLLAPSLILTLSAPTFANPIIDRIASEITVRIEGPQGGSGVILERQNDTYYVITNAHVVRSEGEYQIITPDGQTYPANPSRIVFMPQEDIAILAFRSALQYRTADIGDPEAVAVGNPIYVAGWPKSGGTLGQRIFVNTEGALTHLLSGVDQTHLPLNYTNVVRVGMSGGPVLNQRGEVIGINRLVQLVENTDHIVAAGIKINRIVTWWKTAAKPLAVAPPPVPAPSRTAPRLAGGGYELAQTLKIPQGFLGAVGLSPNLPQAIATGHSDGQIILWNVTTGKPFQTLTGHTKAINSLVITPDGQTLISGSDDRTIKIWDLPSAALKTTLTGHRDTVSALAVSPDSQTLISGSWDNQIYLWNLRTYERLHSLSGHDGLISALAITPDGKTLMSGSQDTTIRLWNLRTHELVKTLKGHRLSVLSLAISADGQTLVSGGGEGVIHLWDLKTGELKKILNGHTDGVWSLALTPDGKTLASGSWDKTIRFWDLPTTQWRSTLKGHSDYVIALMFSANGQTLVSGGLNNEILIWKKQE